MYISIVHVLAYKLKSVISNRNPRGNQLGASTAYMCIYNVYIQCVLYYTIGGQHDVICNMFLFPGFIYVGTYLHQFIHLTQYIAPLQADFNPGLNETATVLVYGTGELHVCMSGNMHVLVCTCTCTSLHFDISRWRVYSI